ncbi:hypothetical protein B0H14DRAFT_2617031 [Mycena olivaceomarginata]|nr:hypothetical protein B0H14DRAFT_2617031 [Mycena olivaceomarginata]
MAPRGNKGFFFRGPLQLLRQHLPGYLAAKKKNEFWATFWPIWDEAYPKLEGDELLKELVEEEAAFTAETARVQKKNKAALTNTLQKLKRWFSNAKTKERSRKVEPFRAWLARLTSANGAPRRIQLPWVVWQHAKHGEELRALYRETYKVEADEEEEEEGADLDENDEGEGEEGETGREGQGDESREEGERGREGSGGGYQVVLQEAERGGERGAREDEGGLTTTRGAQHMEGLLKGEAACSSEELARVGVFLGPSVFCVDPTRRFFLKRTLEAALRPNGMQGDDYSWGSLWKARRARKRSVMQGELPRHAGVNFAKWALAHSKALMQAFMDLVACKKDRDGGSALNPARSVLGSITNPGPPNTSMPSLCSQCMGSLIPLPGQPSSWEREKAQEPTQAKGNGGKGKGRARAEEAVDAGTEDEEEEDEEEEDEEEEDELQSSVGATPAPNEEEEDELQSSAGANPGAQ